MGFMQVENGRILTKVMNTDWMQLGLYTIMTEVKILPYRPTKSG